MNKLGVIGFSSLLATSVLLSSPGKAVAGTEDYIGEIMWTAANFCPRNTISAEGQLLPISQYTALFSLLGTTYGGDGRTSLGLPDLRGRSSVGQGTGPGLSNIRQGQEGGRETYALSTANMPSHNHGVSLNGTTEAGNADSPANAVQANKRRSGVYNDSLSANTAMDPSSISQNNVGGNLSFPTRSPYVGMRACIVVQGIFPSRS